MRRRGLLTAWIAGAAALAAPRIARSEAARVLKFIPQSGLATLDPHFTTASVTREHGLMVFDTLYGMDNSYRPQPQMVEGHVVSDGGRSWELTLRDGLRFHDGTPVLARDAVASIRRWGQRDAFGAVMLARTDEISAPTDKLIRLRMNKPFALVPDALAVLISVPVVMPERLATTDPYKQVTEMVGSGPYRFVADERVVGSRVVEQPWTGKGAVAYTAAKSAVVAMARATAAEVLQYGVRVNAILPSTMDTPANRAAMPNADPSSWVPLRAAADLIAFLLSDESRHISGVSVPIYGRA